SVSPDPGAGNPRHGEAPGVEAVLPALLLRNVVHAPAAGQTERDEGPLSVSVAWPRPLPAPLRPRRSCGPPGCNGPWGCRAASDASAGPWARPGRLGRRAAVLVPSRAPERRGDQQCHGRAAALGRGGGSGRAPGDPRPCGRRAVAPPAGAPDARPARARIDGLS